MKKTIIFPILLANLFFGQVGIGTAHPRGALDINKGDGSNTSGLVLPANSDVNNILNPQIQYQNSVSGMHYKINI
ncbi:hypothetical protein SAMN05421841_3821 [Chryseobacterium wanjuense]|uniref:Uncharacterized protein n=1 Tax=Chryseobacterium wanjuense TaxID=356305 RepID=A0A1I0S1Q2_9FLAO|nr:hypothetical protein [Chryseobacterium wanjuense]SEW48375.1 hypothetical protein SAMN05421841_3821 [Chryseobacterium wanjuense]